MDSIESGGTTVESVNTTLRIIDALDSLGEARITDLSEELGMPKSTIHRHISTLEDRQLIRSEGPNIKLSTKFIQFGQNVRTQFDTWDEIGHSLKELAENTEERVNFYVSEFGRSVCIHQELGKRGIVAMDAVGERFPMHCTAAGKAMLSLMSDNEVDSVIDRHGLPGMTNNTITSREELFEEIEKVRETELSINDEELSEDLRAIGVPTSVHSDEIPGAIILAGPTNRLSEARIESELREALLSTRNELRLKRNY